LGEARSQQGAPSDAYGLNQAQWLRSASCCHDML
jgi:hypothetical protein